MNAIIIVGEEKKTMEIEVIVVYRRGKLTCSYLSFSEIIDSGRVGAGGYFF